MKIAFFARASHAHAIPPLPIGGLGGLSGYIKVFIAIYDLCTFADGAAVPDCSSRRGCLQDPGMSHLAPKLRGHLSSKGHPRS